MKTIRARYQLKKSIFACCTIDGDVEDSQEFPTEWRGWVSVRKPADTLLAVGTVLTLSKSKLQGGKLTKSYSTVTVQKHTTEDSRKYHVFSAETPLELADRRQVERKTTDFKIFQQQTDLRFQVLEGSIKGLTIQYMVRQSISSLSVDQPFAFYAQYKDKTYHYQGMVKHIQYDWKTFEHHVGLQMEKITSGEDETVFNLLLDPDYTVDISHDEAIDTSEGKISKA